MRVRVRVRVRARARARARLCGHGGQAASKPTQGHVRLGHVRLIGPVREIGHVRVRARPRALVYMVPSCPAHAH